MADTTSACSTVCHHCCIAAKRAVRNTACENFAGRMRRGPFIAHLPGLVDRAADACGLEHVAYTYTSLGDLLDVYVRLHAEGITPCAAQATGAARLSRVGPARARGWAPSWRGC